MRLIKIIGGAPVEYSISALRRDNPGVSFPESLSASLFAEYDVYEVEAAPPPAYDPMTQRLVESDPVESEPGLWRQSWLVESLSPEDVAAITESLSVNEATAPENLAKALEVLSRVLLDSAKLSPLGDDDLNAVAVLFAPWRAGDSFQLGEIRKHEGSLWVCEQAHSGQSDHQPGTVPALWSRYRDPAAGPQPWRQLTPPDTYDEGDQVTHDNPNDGGTIWVYESAIDANTTEPGRDGTFDRYWTPIGLPVGAA